MVVKTSCARVHGGALLYRLLLEHIRAHPAGAALALVLLLRRRRVREHKQGA
jgi:hypothetical protein